ncbi:MAG: DUF4390 domain-containing protein [Rubrivivax sp.]|nr:DUF4390 domain-containing protein [Rubrivivax sp.]
MHRRRPIDRRQLLGLGAMLLAGSTLPRPAQARGDAVELVSLQTMRSDGALTLEFVTQVILPRAVEDALQRGVPVYFMAQATLWRNRWYWRDERIARVSRTWRLAYQPLTSTWRVGLGGLNQNYPTLAEAMATVTRLSQWRLVDLSQIDPDSSYSIDFSWRLDTSQLPSPMLIGLIGGSEFSIGVERSLRLE